MKTKTNFFSSVKKISATALIVLIATTAIWYADFATVKSKIQNMIAADSWDFGYIITNVFHATTWRIRWEYLDPTSPIWNNNGNDIYYSTWSVGIGTSSPAMPLHVNSSGYWIIGLGNNDANGFHITKESSDNSFNIWSGVNWAGVNRFRIDSAGSVGIWTNSPARALSVWSAMHLSSQNNTDNEADILFDLAGLVAAEGSLHFNADSDNSWGDTIYFGMGTETNNSSKKMTITGSGNVGIWTITPNKPLHVQFSGDNGMRIKSTDSLASLHIDSGAVGAPQYLRFEENGVSNFWIQATTTALNFRPNGQSTPSAIFYDNGNVSIDWGLNVSCVWNCF